MTPVAPDSPAAILTAYVNSPVKDGRAAAFSPVRSMLSSPAKQESAELFGISRLSGSNGPLQRILKNELDITRAVSSHHPQCLFAVCLLCIAGKLCGLLPNFPRFALSIRRWPAAIVKSGSGLQSDRCNSQAIAVHQTLCETDIPIAGKLL